MGSITDVLALTGCQELVFLEEGQTILRVVALLLLLLLRLEAMNDIALQVRVHGIVEGRLVLLVIIQTLHVC
jgi:hypothetical protein